MAHKPRSSRPRENLMRIDPNKFLVALLIVSVIGLGSTYAHASSDLTPNVFDLCGNILVATIFGMLRP